MSDLLSHWVKDVTPQADSVKVSYLYLNISILNIPISLTVRV